jgi:hypothetical protein
MADAFASRTKIFENAKIVSWLWLAESFPDCFEPSILRTEKIARQKPGFRLCVGNKSIRRELDRYQVYLK